MCVICEIDPQKAEKFGENLLQIANHGAVSLMISIGHRTGLFDAMYCQPAMTSEEVAEAAGLNERYVREWLAAMAVSRIVEIDPEGPTYLLPPEHGALLSRHGSDNVAPIFQYIPVLSYVEDKIVDCFKHGGGVSYDEFNRFHDAMAEDSGMSVLPVLLDQILPLIPGIQQKLKDGIEVADFACGMGKALILMAKTYPNSRFYGYDLCEEPLEKARQEARQLGLTNVEFIRQDLTFLDENERFDLIATFDGVHDQGRPDLLLKNIFKALKPDGYYLMQDIDASSHVHKNLDHPFGPLLYTASTNHCMTVSLAQGGMGLGTMWGIEKAEEMLNEAGFSKIAVNRLPHDLQNYYMVIQKS